MAGILTQIGDIRTEKFWVDEPTDRVRLSWPAQPQTLTVWMNSQPVADAPQLLEGQDLVLGTLREQDVVFARYITKEKGS